MSQKIRLWEVTQQDTLNEITSDEIDLEQRLEEWLANDISLLDPDLLVIGRQVRTAYDGEIDLLYMDSTGDLVVVELKKGRTPREVTAQTLDYASWVKDLGFEKIQEIAERYFKSNGLNVSLEDAFQERFENPLLDTLNESHRSLIVAGSMDASTERIVRYLSELKVPINVATVQHFTAGSGREILAKMFLVEPEEAEARARPTSKKQKRPNMEQIKEIAYANGVGELYDGLRASVSGILNVAPFGQTSLGFCIKTEEGLSTMFVVELEESDQDRGLAFRLNGIRLRNAFGLTPEQLDSILPKDREQTFEWKGATPEERDNLYLCHLHGIEEVGQFVSALRK